MRKVSNPQRIATNLCNGYPVFLLEYQVSNPQRIATNDQDYGLDA